MARNSKEVIYLVDHEKINLPSKSVVMTADSVDIIIADYTFDENFKEKYNRTKFIEV